jgi:hypothetical protein
LFSRFSQVTMSWTVSLFEFVTTDSNVEADQTTALETQTVSNFSKSASFDGMTSTMITKVQLLSIVLGLVGIIINVIVFTTLRVFKEFRKNTTNVFICNQTIIDVVACLALTVTMLIRRIGASDYVVGFNRRILCWFIDNNSLLGATLNASTFSLIVIALERYFKIVHPIKHRNNFRPWMVKLGVIAPWIDGLFVIILPEWLTSDVVDGECRIALENHMPEAVLYIYVCMARHCSTFDFHFLLFKDIYCRPTSKSNLSRSESAK